MLFNPDMVYDRYRIAFFMNAANQHSAQDWLLDAVQSTSELLGDSNPEGKDLLMGARTLLAQRYNCYGCIELPPSCTRQMAWSALRELFVLEDYYLSVPEIMVPAIVLGFSVAVYRHRATASANDALDFLAEYRAANTDAKAYLVLDIQEGDAKMRGHFSRLYSEAAWKEHMELQGSDDLIFSDTSLSSEESSASDSGSVSGADDVGRNAMLGDQPLEDDA